MWKVNYDDDDDDDDDCIHRASEPHLGSVYTGPDPFGTHTKLVRINLVFTLDLVYPVRIGSAVWYKMGPYGTVPFQFRTGPV